MVLKSMPLMPDLDMNFNPDEEEEEDAAEEKNLMTILLKLKTAKSSLDASRKRKHYQQNIDDAYTAVSKENKDQLNKHKKRWSAKINQFSVKANLLKDQSDEALQKVQESNRECMTAPKLHRTAVDRLLASFKELEKEVETLRDPNHREMIVKEIANARFQVEDKMKQLEGVLKRINSEAGKEDRFSKLIKTIMCNF